MFVAAVCLVFQYFCRGAQSPKPFPTWNPDKNGASQGYLELSIFPFVELSFWGEPVCAKCGYIAAVTVHQYSILLKTAEEGCETPRNVGYWTSFLTAV